MSKHTPGPWTGAARSLWINANDKTPVAYVEASDADFQLMVAAPQLLEALKVVLDDLMYKDHARVIDVARAAIAKAEGEKT